MNQFATLKIALIWNTTTILIS